MEPTDSGKEEGRRLMKPTLPPLGDDYETGVCISDAGPADPETMAEIDRIAKHNQASLDEMMARGVDPRRCHVTDIRQRTPANPERRPL
jgi:hypothetical protein